MMPLRELTAWALAAMLCLVASQASARPHQPIDSTNALDKQISVCLEYLAEGDIDAARLLARQIAWRFPDFALGQLIYAELESAAAFSDVAIAAHQPIARQVSELLLEARQRLRAASTELPGDLVQIGKGVSQVILVDLQSSVLYQYESSNQLPALIRQHYIGSGEAGFGKRLEGDLKTPLGIYNITSTLSDSVLPDLYGAGALTLDYPNALDHHLGRTGYGIWLHGVPPDQRSRSPYSSEGCVTMSNEHFVRLSDSLDVSQTRVILTNGADPLSADTRAELRQRFQDLFNRYQQAWLDGNHEQLMSLYSDHAQLHERYSSGIYGLMRVGKKPLQPHSAPADSHEHLLYRKAFAALTSQDISIFRNPDVADNPLAKSGMVINAVFGPANEYQLTIYWSQDEHGEWRILTEETPRSSL